MLTVSRLEKVKRVDLAIDAFAHVPGPTRLIVAGDGSVRADAGRPHRGAAGSSDRVQLLGHVADAELIDLLAGARGVLFAPFQEDYGYVTLEAFLREKPVVTTTDAGGPLEFVEDGVNGFVRAPDAEALAAAVTRLAANASRGRAARRARLRARAAHHLGRRRRAAAGGRARGSALCQRRCTWARAVRLRMRPVVIVPTYNERANIARAGAGAARHRRASRADRRTTARPTAPARKPTVWPAASGGRMSVIHRTGPRGLRPLATWTACGGAARPTPRTSARWTPTSRTTPPTCARMLDAAPHADLVIGSRYVPGGALHNWPRRRRLLSAFANWYVRSITGLRGPRLHQRLPLLEPRRCSQRLPWATCVRRLRVPGGTGVGSAAPAAASSKSPITFVERREGASKLSWRVIAESAVLPVAPGIRARAAGRLVYPPRPVNPTAVRPSISAFFPCYNDEQTIGRPGARSRRRSCAALTDDYEIIVVNDGSRDGSAAVLGGARRRRSRACGWSRTRSTAATAARCAAGSRTPRRIWSSTPTATGSTT